MKPWWQRNKGRVSIALLLLLFVADVVIWYAMIRENRRDFLRVSFLDIGQGDAIYIEAPNGNQVVVDGGPSSILLRRLGEAMPFYDHSLDALIVTNPDKDHFAGFVDALPRYKVGALIESGTQNVSAAFAALTAEAKADQIPLYILHRGDRIVLDEKHGITLEVLFPDRDASALATNTGSLVTKLSYGSVCFMLMGDAPQGVEEYLVQLYGDQLRCQVLKAGHHGSKTASSPLFVADVAPGYAVISDGKNNQYGFPHQETLDTLNKLGVKILRTDELGTITFETDGRDLVIK